MKHFYIGLVALAAVALAGCGGGSDNGSGADGEFAVATAGITPSRLAELGDRYTVPAGGTESVRVAGGTIVFRGCPSSATGGCTVTVSTVNNRVVVMATDDDVTARFEAAPADRTDRLEQENRRLEQENEELEQERDEAEDKIEDLETLVGETTDQLKRAQARRALDGLDRFASGSRTAETVSDIVAANITPKHQAIATVAPSGITLTNKSGASAGAEPRAKLWYVSTFGDSSRATHVDNVVVYSDLDRRKSVDINTKHEIFGRSGGPQSSWVGTLTDAQQLFIKSSSFPQSSGAAQPATNNYDFNNDGTNDRVRYSGTFDGVSGHYECDDDSCSVRNANGAYIFPNGTWTFTTSGATAKVLVEDDSYMYFGWWRSEVKNGRTLDFETFYDSVTGDEDGIDASTFNALTNSATYTGKATGQFAIHNAIGDTFSSGSFTARASLEANFDTNMLSGTITNFSNDKSWSLVLNGASMAGGSVGTAGATSWRIGDDSDNGGTTQAGNQWVAEFHSEGEYVGQVPEGVVGEFSAMFSDEARLVGAFGAHCTSATSGCRR